MQAQDTLIVQADVGARWKAKMVVEGWLTLLVLDLTLDVVDGVAGLHLQGDGLPCESLDEDLHATTQPQDQVEGGLLLDVIVRQGAAILQLLAGKDQALLVGWNACNGPCGSANKQRTSRSRNCPRASHRDTS